LNLGAEAAPTALKERIVLMKRTPIGRQGKKAGGLHWLHEDALGNLDMPCRPNLIKVRRWAGEMVGTHLLTQGGKGRHSKKSARTKEKLSPEVCERIGHYQKKKVPGKV